MNPEGFIPYAQHSYGEEEVEAAARVIRGGRVSQGPESARFEELAARWCGARFAVAVSSGTAALHLAFLALDLKPGDEVIVPAWTFVATASAALLAGGTPVPADIDPRDLNISPESAAARITPRTRAICPVHFGGEVAALPELARLAGRDGIALIEDAAHALGARALDPERGPYRIGRASRSLAACFSLHPSKSITTGEGGLVMTEDEELSRRVRQLRNHGLAASRGAPAAHPGAGARLERLGLNYRLGEVACAIGSVQLGRLAGFIARRAELAARYRTLLASVPGIRLPASGQGCEPSFNLFVVRVEGGEEARDRLIDRLNRLGIGAAFHYPPLHRHPFYRGRPGFSPSDCPRAEACAAEALTLPLSPRMADRDVDRVVEGLKRSLC